MKKLFTLSAALFSLSVFSQAPVANPVVAEEDQLAYGVIIHPGDYVPEQLLVMLEPNADMGGVEQAFAAKGFVLKETKLISPIMRAWTITFVSGTNTEKALAAARAIPQLQMAQFNHYVAHRANIPNDAQFGNMWDMNNTGQSGGTPDADIDAPEAWDITTGGLTSQGDTIVVAVIDAGFDLAQPDLNFWKNYAEIPNNGIDDDNNGYIDDFDGWDAYNSDGVISSDLHGTHVCGTVGARGNNTIGVTGVNWGVKVMPVMGSDGTEAVVVEAYTYVMQARRLYNQTNGAQGAFVVSTNSSFGVDQGQPLQYPIWCAMYDSMGVEGILSAAATANQNWDIDQVGDIPTACTSDYLISVTNTTRFDQKNNSAGYGTITIDLGAPGTTIYSTLPNAGYGTLTGTSMATPHVAGAVALMYAAACPQLITDYKANPDSIALMMRSYLLGNVDQISSMNGIVSSNGRLNVYHAVQGVESYPNCAPLGQNEQPQNGISLLYPNPASQNVQLIYRSSSTGSVQFVITDMLGQVVQTSTQTANAGMNSAVLDISSLGAGVYFVQMIQDGTTGTAQRLVVQ